MNIFKKKRVHNWLPHFYEAITARNSGGNYANYKLRSLYCTDCEIIFYLDIEEVS